MKKSLLLKSVMTLVACFLGFAAASAETVDLGVLVPGQTYSFPGYSVVSGTYTPSVTGPVKFIYHSCSPLELYSAADHNENSIVGGSHAYSGSNQVKSYANLEGGKTYYLYTAFSQMAGSFTIVEGDIKLELESVAPSPEVPFSVSSNYVIDFAFNAPVSVGNALLILDKAGTRYTLTPAISNTYVTLEVADNIMEAYRQDLLKEGDTFTVRLTQVKDASNPDNRYGTNGRVEAKFTVMAKPAELKEIINASRTGVNILDTYYLPGDPRAVVKLIFDRDLSTEKEPSASLLYGNPDNVEIGMYTETVQGSNSAATATFDLAGVRRRPIDMLPASDATTQPEYISISMTNLFTPDNQRVYTGVRSNPSGFAFSFYINQISYSISADFTPARDSKISSNEPMEMWVMNGKNISFDAVRFDYTENGEPKYAEVPFANIRVSEDPFSPEDYLFNFDIPEMKADEGSEVKLSIVNLMCGDGLDHSKDISASFIFTADNSAVDSVASEAVAYDVFDIAGVKVLSNASRAELSNLPAGLYIVNGQKLLKK
ncbi:MAG: hypothetical protein NC328_07410 [Muribaculum sp.]|nr:hypothetical protein [Muribaculum sp.]